MIYQMRKMRTAVMSPSDLLAMQTRTKTLRVSVKVVNQISISTIKYK